MSELISRQDAIDAVHYEFDECLVWDESGQTTADEVERILDYLPSADAVPVVRCKDCKWRGDLEPKNRYTDCYCHVIGWTTEPDWFCADGERRDDAVDH